MLHRDTSAALVLNNTKNYSSLWQVIQLPQCDHAIPVDISCSNYKGVHGASRQFLFFDQ
jgi:hypothetical protein